MTTNLDLLKTLSGIKESAGQGTYTMWHGGKNLESDYRDFKSAKKGRAEYGPGIYLINDYTVAANYAKGGKSTYLVSFRKGTDISQVKVSVEEMTAFIKRNVPKRLHANYFQFLERAENRTNDGTIPIEFISNMMGADELGTGKSGMALRQFLIDHGVDYATYKGYGGDGSRVMVVIINPKVITDITKMKASDINVDMYTLNSVPK